MMRELLLSARQLSECRGKIVHGIREAVNSARAKGVVFGMSGGVDSSLIAKLASEAVKDVHALMLPEAGVSDPRDLSDAVKLAEHLKINYSIIEIDKVIGAVSEEFPWREHNLGFKKKAFANIKPRVRMVYNYIVANLDGRLVLGTTNKTEFFLGYFTKHGDGACDLEPIGGLYKTQVIQLARHLGIPDSIVNKTPTAGLWKGQTDESEIGMKYSEMDAILHNLVDLNLSIDEAARRTGLGKGNVEKIANKMSESKHKRQIPRVIEV
jgi:NAD+ synthase